jgi:hypothetical protein
VKACSKHGEKGLVNLQQMPMTAPEIADVFIFFLFLWGFLVL